MDRISDLPTKILHQILYLLPTKTAARTAVLSKPWLKACYTNPYLCFDQSDSEPPRPHNGMFIDFHDQFVKIVDNTLERYRRENLPISVFNLRISFSNQTDCDGLIDKWLDIIAQKSVLQVSLLLNCRSGGYSLLAESIFAIESLQQLEMNRCRILKQKALLSEDKIKCINLKNLTLCSVTVSESALDTLILCCSQIVTISFQYCIGFNCIRLSKKFPNLLSLDILSCPIKEVHIDDAPKMLSFEYVNYFLRFYKNFSNVDGEICLRMLNIGTCQNVRKVEVMNGEIDDTALFELIQKLPFIKELILHYYNKLNKIKISSSTLEVCSIAYCDYLVQAIFDVPKLLYLTINLTYVIDKRTRLPCLSFESHSTKCRISIMYGDLYDAEEYIDLQRSLIELRDQVVELRLYRICVGLRVASGIDHIPLPEVEKLILIAYYSTCYFHNIFSLCWPKSLTFEGGDKRFRKYLRQQLLRKRRWSFTRCTWKEYMMNAQIEYKKRIQDDWITLDRKILAADTRIFEVMHAVRLTLYNRPSEMDTLSWSDRYR